ncbi:hypothetical protein Y032_0004g2229 [Ancylostoma ceylanicum]|uniref:Uncharacterized protein n=1 Tax=Ancylostoma ceylanicum TaxID=53326 RepID=A0A016VWB1_9BILA|nr:hypothetical protein Y032_0004g2229 [Ancylostoma ceylanicum]
MMLFIALRAIQENKLRKYGSKRDYPHLFQREGVKPNWYIARADVLLRLSDVDQPKQSEDDPPHANDDGFVALELKREP